MTNWKPGASIENLRIRAELLGRIRNFFRARDVLEVDTPLLAPTTATDPHLESFQLPVAIAGQEKTFYLQTSPEFAMKRVVAAGTGPVYQICKAFRQDEISRRHNPEFTMLEWYRPGFSIEQLMDEVETLVKEVLGVVEPSNLRRISYAGLFQQHLAVNPHKVSEKTLKQLAASHIELNSNTLQRDEYLHLLLSHVIEPAMNEDCFVYDFPCTQAALAKIDTDDAGNLVARRFELYLNKMEIANGYLELTDPVEQRQRHMEDLQKRHDAGKAQYPVDEKLLAAMTSGLPACSGVALGVDRLLMIAAGTEKVGDVISFPIDRI